jgi:hypothetical protein
LRDAENRGFDVATELPMLVTGRSFDNAEDVASVLHHRVNRYVTGVGYPSPVASQLVAGIFPRPSGITDPDVVFALDDRAYAVEQRARELATIAIERDDVWVKDFGDAPPKGELYELWAFKVSTGAAYLDRWGVNNADRIPDDATIDSEQETQRSRVLNAARRARDLVMDEEISALRTNAQSSDEIWKPPSQDFGLDL